MRLIAVLLLLLGACQREPSFDERYAKTREQLEQKAAEIDRAVATPAPSATPDAK